MVKNAIEGLVASRLMLREDAQAALNRLLRAGEASAIKMDSRPGD
jgi:hypothetical protein